MSYEDVRIKPGDTISGVGGQVLLQVRGLGKHLEGSQ